MASDPMGDYDWYESEGVRPRDQGCASGQEESRGWNLVPGRASSEPASTGSTMDQYHEGRLLEALLRCLPCCDYTVTRPIKSPSRAERDCRWLASVLATSRTSMTETQYLLPSMPSSSTSPHAKPRSSGNRSVRHYPFGLLRNEALRPSAGCTPGERYRLVWEEFQTEEGFYYTLASDELSANDSPGCTYGLGQHRSYELRWRGRQQVVEPRTFRV